MKGTTILAVLIFLVLPTLALTVGCDKEPPPTVKTATPEEQGATEAFGRITDFQFTRNNQGRVEFELKADSGTYFEDASKIMLEKAKVTFFTKDGRKAFLNADSGIVRTDTQDISAEGNVEIRSEGYKVSTSKLQYDAQEMAIATEEEVTVQSDRLTLRGTGLKMSLKDQTLELGKDVKGTVLP